jgi:hypothetical protein
VCRECAPACRDPPCPICGPRKQRPCLLTWHAGGLCHAGLLAFQLGACFVLPCTLVYLTERRSRRIFLETVVD